MHKRHASSHALATLITMLAATALTAWMRNNISWLIGVVDRFCGFVLIKFPLNIERELLANIVFAVILSAIWGLGFYHLNRKSID